MSGPKAEILERSGWSRDYYGRLEDKAWLVQKGRKERRGERESARWNTFGETVSSFSRASRYLRVDRRFFLNFIFPSNLSLSRLVYLRFLENLHSMLDASMRVSDARWKMLDARLTR